MAGLSGTSFTGYPLPDVAAGINLKNQVTHWIELCQHWKVGSALKHLQGQIFKKDLFGKESAAGRNLRKRMSGTAEVRASQKNEKDQLVQKSMGENMEKVFSRKIV